MKLDANETLEQARARNIRDALLEDLGTGDWTGLLVLEGRRVSAVVRVREDAVLCGRDWFDGVMRTLDAQARVEWDFDEGADMPANSTVCRIQADARAMLSGERPALDFLQLFLPGGIGRIHHMQQHVRINRLLQRGLERID